MQVFRLHALIDGIACRMEFHNTTHCPFGYRSECRLGGVLLQHELVADDNVLFHRIKALDNPSGAKVTARICQTCASFAHEDGRTSKGWIRSFDNGALSTPIVDDGKEISVRIGIAAGKQGIFKPVTHQFKAYILSATPADEHLFYRVFTPREEEELLCCSALWTGSLRLPRFINSNKFYHIDRVLSMD